MIHASTTGPSAAPPILTAHLFPQLESKLIELLRSLSAEEWELQTIAPKWKVRQVAAHLLDTQLRKLSIVRDGFVAERPSISSHTDMVAFINQLNAEGVAHFSRLSPAVLISMMERASAESCAFHASLDPLSRAAFAVSWAGETESLNWFDTARELTERWHHQQQIRLAVKRPGIMTRELYHPVLETFMRALPFRYREVNAPERTLVRIEVSGDCGGNWFLLRRSGEWTFDGSGDQGEAASAVIPQEIAWRVFTKGISRNEALKQVVMTGDTALAEHVIGTTAIMG